MNPLLCFLRPSAPFFFPHRLNLAEVIGAALGCSLSTLLSEGYRMGILCHIPKLLKPLAVVKGENV